MSQHRGDRSEQQDAFDWLCEDDRTILAVADGLGGHEGGAEAARFVVTSLMTRLADTRIVDPKEDLMRVFNELMIHFRHHQQQGHTTLACAIVQSMQLHTLHIGDSRIYRLSRERWHSKDHSVVQLLIDDNEIDMKEAAVHRSRHQLYKSISLKKQHRPRIVSQHLSPGDVVCVCSDGFWSKMATSDWAEFRRDCSQHKLDQLVSTMVSRGVGRSDNVTALALKVKI